MANGIHDDHPHVEDGPNDLHGGTGDDSLNGHGGDDTLAGRAGDDRLNGGTGDDHLIGGSGHDVLSGGSGHDRFDFNFVNESPKGKGHDVITDFHHVEDRIDLRHIDAEHGAGNQAFHWIGSHAFTNHAGELHFVRLGHDGVLLQGDTNGDGVADFEVHLRHITGLHQHDVLL
jgi:serralysin